MSGIFKLRGVLKTYEWGKVGFDSCVAQLYKSAYDDFEVDPNTPFAELWMGTHPSGMATIPSMNNMALSDWISQNPACLGPNITSNFDDSGLPFLFKVLSIRKALSIQVHPDKQSAKILHEKAKDKYPDDNHKPELAIAVTPFQALCGFRPISEIKSFVMELPQLQEVIGHEESQNFLSSDGDRNDLKTIFTALITKEKFEEHLSKLVEHLKNCTTLSDLCKSIKNVFLKVHEQFPGDIGCFCVFFLNHIVLKPGQSIFLAANEPHAYLEGDCIECMACSDNVVRAGLTPKFKDVQTLLDMLTYNSRSADDNLFHHKDCVMDLHLKIFDPPVPEFAVCKIEINCSKSIYSITEMDSASLLLVQEGEAVTSCSENMQLKRGTILFISSGSKVEMQIISEKILMYRAYCSALPKNV